MIDLEGWFDIGDFGWIVLKMGIGCVWCCGGVLILDGWVKDIIVFLIGFIIVYKVCLWFFLN